MGWFGSTLLRSGTFSAYNGFSMIQANCRARFTAADFDFVVRTLARSQSESVSLVDLLADSETRDSVIDSPRLVEAILCNDSQLRISSNSTSMCWRDTSCVTPESAIANCAITSVRCSRISLARIFCAALKPRPTNRRVSISLIC